MTTQNEIKDARVGYIVADLSTGNVIGQRNPNLQFHMASVIKLIILAAALAEVDKGRLSLTEVIPVAELHNDADHTLFRRDTSTMKMSELLCAMASQNNSVIADYFLALVGYYMDIRCLENRSITIVSLLCRIKIYLFLYVGQSDSQ